MKKEMNIRYGEEVVATKSIFQDYDIIKRVGDEDYIEKYGCPQCVGMCEITE